MRPGRQAKMWLDDVRTGIEGCLRKHPNCGAAAAGLLTYVRHLYLSAHPATREARAMAVDKLLSVRISRGGFRTWSRDKADPRYLPCAGTYDSSLYARLQATRGGAFPRVPRVLIRSPAQTFSSPTDPARRGPLARGAQLASAEDLRSPFRGWSAAWPRSVARRGNAAKWRLE